MEELTEVQFEAGQNLFETDHPLDSAWFILEGKVELNLKLGNKDITVELGENQFVGDASVAVSQKEERSNLSYNAKAVALEPVTAVQIPVEDIKIELNNCPPLLKAWFASFVNRMLVLVQKLTTEEVAS